MNREEQIKKAWGSAFKNIVESIDAERTKEDVACMFFELGCRWADENRTNWQQVRIQAAIAAMQLIQTDETFKRWVQERVEEGGVYYEEYPNVAVEIADHLIVALKQEPWIPKENDIKL